MRGLPQLVLLPAVRKVARVDPDLLDGLGGRDGHGGLEGHVRAQRYIITLLEQALADLVAGLRPDEQALVANAQLARQMRGFADPAPDMGPDVRQAPGF